MSRLAATRDHTQPKSQGGEHRVWACKACNNRKADMDIDEWVDFMANNPRWWAI